MLACDATRFNAATDEIAEALPNPTVVTVPGDHFAFLEPDNRAAWSRAILDFLN